MKAFTKSGIALVVAIKENEMKPKGKNRQKKVVVYDSGKALSGYICRARDEKRYRNYPGCHATKKAALAEAGRMVNRKILHMLKEIERLQNMKFAVKNVSQIW